MKHLIRTRLAIVCLGLTISIFAKAQHPMSFDARGLTMNSNDSELPLDCSAISSTFEFTVHVGTEYAKQYPGTVFGMSDHELHVEPCALVTLNFVNDDEIRHQWMLHGLPRYLYPEGMFHLEANGGESRSGSFIVPSDHQTYLIHCDMTQHMEKGMKAQLVVGRGSGDLWSIPGISREFKLKPLDSLLAVLLVITMLIISFLVWVFLNIESAEQD